VTSSRRFSQAISEGEAISLIADVASAADAADAETHGADALLVSPATEAAVEPVRAASSLPLIVEWAGNPAAGGAVDACILAIDADADWLERVYGELRDALEVAFLIEDEEQLESALEAFDPEIFVLGAPATDGEEALERVLDLLPDVPAGKLAIAELASATRDDIAALERAGFDAVIVEPQRVAELAGDEPPDV
jgi:hypothetical protein